MTVFYTLMLGWAPSLVIELEVGLKDGYVHPNEAKMRLAREIVAIYHSPSDADAAQKRWDEVFRNKSGSGVPTDIEEAPVMINERVVSVLVRLKMVASGKEATRLIEQGGIRLNDAPVTDLHATVSADMLPAVLQVGKRKFVRLVVQS